MLNEFLIKKTTIKASGNLVFDKEISQADNSNATATLWIQNDFTVYKKYVIRNEVSEKNIYNLLRIVRKKSLRRIPELSLPLAIYSDNGKVDGYLMEYYNMQSLNSATKERQHAFVLHAFHLLADLINRLPRDVFVGDLHAGNVLVGDNVIRLIDIDGFSLKHGHKISCPLATFSNHSVFSHKKYCDRKGGFQISRESDIACVLWLFLNYLMETNPFHYTEKELRRYLSYLKDLGLPESLYEMIACMFSPAHNYLIPSAFKEIPLELFSHCSYKHFVCACK